MNLLEAVDRLTNTKIRGAYISCDDEHIDAWHGQLYIGNSSMLSKLGIYFEFDYEDIISNDWCLYNAEGQQIS